MTAFRSFGLGPRMDCSRALLDLELLPVGGQDELNVAPLESSLVGVALETSFIFDLVGV